MLIILFGLSGSGKNFIAEILQETFDFDWLDGDDFLTAEMKEAIQHKKIFTQLMRDDFTQKLIQIISKEDFISKNLVITQALYKEKNRQQILAAFPEAKFIYVKADIHLIQQRFKQKINNISLSYAENIQTQFELPKHFFAELINNAGKDEIIKQIISLVIFPRD